MVQNLYKNWLLVSKIIWGIWITSDKQWKSKKWKFNGLHLPKKYIPSAETYTEDLSKLLSTSVKIHQTPYVIFETIFEVIFHDTTRLYILAQTLHTFDKNVPSKWKCSYFQLLAWKLTRFLVTFQAMSQFSLKFCITVQCHLSSVFFISDLYTLDKNSPSKWNFQTFEWLGENLPNSLCHVWNYKSVFI